MEDYQSYKKPLSCKLLIFIHLFLGTGAVFGGGAFVIDPSGDLIKMPITLLDQSPFTDFLIPGIILLVVLGIIPIFIAYSLSKRWQWKIANRLNIYKNMHWSWTYSLYIGFALIIWITVQVFFIGEVATIHLVYIALGLLIQGTTLLPQVQNYYKNK